MAETTNVLVTGGAGFIGSHLVNGLLDSGYSVAVVDDLSSGQLRNLNHQATFYHCPINDPKLVQIIQREGPEIIFHLAAQSSVRQSTLDPVSDADSNVLGTIRLLSAAAAEGVDKIVFSSTGGAIYGNPDTIPCDEDTPVNPITPYAMSKYVSELYLDLYQRTYGLEYTILRYANVYGPGQNPNGEAGVIAIFAGTMLRGRTPNIYGGRAPGARLRLRIRRRRSQLGSRVSRRWANLQHRHGRACYHQSHSRSVAGIHRVSRGTGVPAPARRRGFANRPRSQPCQSGIELGTPGVS